jgi:hypothetical protein
MRGAVVCRAGKRPGVGPYDEVFGLSILFQPVGNFVPWGIDRPRFGKRLIEHCRSQDWRQMEKEAMAYAEN